MEMAHSADQPASEASEDIVAAKRAGFARQGSALLAQHGAANAALKLLDDLCMMVTGVLLLIALRYTQCIL